MSRIELAHHSEHLLAELCALGLSARHPSIEVVGPCLEQLTQYLHAALMNDRVLIYADLDQTVGYITFRPIQRGDPRAASAFSPLGAQFRAQNCIQIDPPVVFDPSRTSTQRHEIAACLVRAVLDHGRMNGARFAVAYYNREDFDSRPGLFGGGMSVKTDPLDGGKTLAATCLMM